jgi:hypothetical protein
MISPKEAEHVLQSLTLLVYLVMGRVYRPDSVHIQHGGGLN